MTNPAPLTDIAIRRLRPPARGQAELWDRKVPGFGVRVSASGTKAFVLLYRSDGRSRRYTLGRYPDLSLAAARAKAHAARAVIASGGNPQLEKDEARGSIVFAAVVDEFLRLHCRQHNRPSTAAETERQLRVAFMPTLGRRRVTEIGKPDVLRILDEIIARGTPSAANHALAAIPSMSTN